MILWSEHTYKHDQEKVFFYNFIYILSKSLIFGICVLNISGCEFTACFVVKYSNPRPVKFFSYVNYSW